MYTETALREVKEEAGVTPEITKYIGKSQYSFRVPDNVVEKEVHWYLMKAQNYYTKPQKEEYFTDAGYYKFHEAYHMLKFVNEKKMLESAYKEYMELKKSHSWNIH